VRVVLCFHLQCYSSVTTVLQHCENSTKTV
jgi:hypothetical protein